MLSNFSNWPRVFSALGPISGVLVLVGCTTREPKSSLLDAEADFAIYLAQIREMKYVGSPECPDGMICMNAIYSMTLDMHEPISGNPLIGVQTFEVVQHTAFADGLILAIHAKRNAADQWQLISREPVDLEVCLPIPAYEAVAMIDDSESPWFAEIRGEQTESEETCFSKYLKD